MGTFSSNSGIIARSRSVCTTQLAMRLMISMESWGRLRISHSSRSVFSTSSSTSVTANAFGDLYTGRTTYDQPLLPREEGDEQTAAAPAGPPDTLRSLGREHPFAGAMAEGRRLVADFDPPLL